MAPPAEALPNYGQHPDSPAIKDLGIAIKLFDPPFQMGSPLILRGAYLADAALNVRAVGQPLTHVLVIVVRRDKPLGHMFSIMHAYNLMPPPIDENAKPADPNARSGGFFNLNLLRASGIITEPGRYWVMAVLGDYVSDRIEFEVKA